MGWQVKKGMGMVFENPCEINKIWWLWLPAVFMIIQIIVEILLSPGQLSHLYSENGPHELLEFMITTIGFCLAMMALFHVRKRKLSWWLSVWLMMAAAGCFYVAGEEISWGQHFLDWTTPEFWTEINDQKETNLHNTSSWLDQKPRILLELGVLTGGLIIPLFRHYKPGVVPERFAMIYPPSVLGFITVMLVVLKIMDEISEVMGFILFERVSEIEELYLYYFVLLYLFVLKRRIMIEEKKGNF